MICLFGAITSLEATTPNLRRLRRKKTFYWAVPQPSAPLKQPTKAEMLRDRIEKAPSHMIKDCQKPIFLETYDDFIKTPIGKQFLDKIDPKTQFHVANMMERGSYICRSFTNCYQLSLASSIFDKDAQTPEDIQIIKLKLAGGFVRVITQGVNIIFRDSSLSDRISYSRLNSLMDIVVELAAQDQMMKVTSVKIDKRKLGKKLPRFAFYEQLKNEKIAEGADPGTAARFARGTVSAIYWSGKTDPVIVNQKSIAPPKDIALWVSKTCSIGYMASFAPANMSMERVKDPDLNLYAENKRIDGCIIYFSKMVDIDVPVSTFVKSVPYTATPKELTVFADGRKICTYHILATGIFREYYGRNDTYHRFDYFSFLSPRQTNGEEYYPDTKNPKFKYTLDISGKIAGTLTRYDEKGYKLYEIPIKRYRHEWKEFNKPRFEIRTTITGNGWISEKNGEKKYYRFAGGMLRRPCSSYVQIQEKVIQEDDKTIIPPVSNPELQ